MHLVYSELQGATSLSIFQLFVFQLSFKNAVLYHLAPYCSVNRNAESKDSLAINNSYSV